MLGENVGEMAGVFAQVTFGVLQPGIDVGRAVASVVGRTLGSPQVELRYEAEPIAEPVLFRAGQWVGIAGVPFADEMAAVSPIV